MLWKTDGRRLCFKSAEQRYLELIQMKTDRIVNIHYIIFHPIWVPQAHPSAAYSEEFLVNSMIQPQVKINTGPGSTFV